MTTEDLLYRVLDELGDLKALLAPPEIDPAAVYSPSQAAKLLGVSRQTVWSANRAGELEALDTGTRKKTYRGAALIAWRDRRSV